MSRRDLGWFSLYIVVLAVVTIKIASMPEYSFDGYMYSYMASSDVQEFKHAPGLPEHYLTLSDDVYRQQAPYYVVKPLFIASVRVARHFTGAVQAPYAVCAFSYFVLGCALWFWLRALTIEGAWRFAAAFLIMASSVVTDTAREGTPDIMCAALTLLGAWLLFSSRVPVAGLLLLALAIFVRPDAIILNGLLAAAAVVLKKITTAKLGVAGIAMAACYVIASRGGHPYSQVLAWGIRTTYLRAFVHNLAKTELAVYAPFVLLAMLASRLAFHRPVLLAVALSVIVRYLAMPVFVVRYLLPAAILVAVLGAAAVLRAPFKDRQFDEPNTPSRVRSRPNGAVGARAPGFPFKLVPSLKQRLHAGITLCGAKMF